MKFLVRLDSCTGRHLKTMRLFVDRLTKTQRLLKCIRLHNKRLKLKMPYAKLKAQLPVTLRNQKTLIQFLKNK